jgi:AraC-like DNA-binding protein
MSRAGFAMRFKQLVGETPLEYLTRWRMYKATRLLRDRGRKLLEVANSVGYDSDAAFNRAFKRMHGVSAGEYRRTIAAT